jgi:alkylation response protein AidB-like acyl-CoA dehydrogenase
MEFGFSPRLEEVRQTARRVAREAVAPRAAEIDATGEYPEDVFEAFREEGLLGLAFPKELGGSGDGTLGLAIAVEEAAKYCCSSGLLLLTTRLATSIILMAGTAEQKERYARGVAEGRLRGCFALTEPGSGSDAASLRSTAVRDGDIWVINGAKLWAGQATVADYAVVIARVGEGSGPAGVRAFLVDLPNPGFRIVRELPKLGVLGVPVVELRLENLRVPLDAVIGTETDGFPLVMRHLSSVRPLVAARGVGLAEGVIAYATEYAKRRKTFGRELMEHEAVSFPLADAAIETEAARLLTYRAAWLVDQGKSGRDVTHYLSMAKLKASEAAIFASDRALQALGGYGYLKDFPIERYYRDARQLTLVEGTSEIQRLIVARALRDGLLDFDVDVPAMGDFPNGI